MSTAKNKKLKTKPWLSVDEAIDVLSRGYEDGFTAADLHDLLQSRQLTVYAYFTGHALEFGQADTDVARPFGNPVIGMQFHQGYIPLPADHSRLRTTLCGIEVDMPELRHGFLKLPKSPGDNYQLLHKPASLPSTETVDGVTHLIETITIPSFTRHELFLRSSEVYGHFSDETIAEEAGDTEKLANRAKGSLLCGLKAFALALTKLPAETNATRLANEVLKKVAAAGLPELKNLKEATLARYLGEAKYPV